MAVRVKPVVREEKCRPCGVCVRHCPGELTRNPQEAGSLRSLVYVKAFVRDFETTPCRLACPLEQDVRTFVRLILEEEYRHALDVIRESNALPGVTAYVCHHPCEDGCTRGVFDQPLSVRELKRFLVDHHYSAGGREGVCSRRRDGKVVIVGSGPAGLAAGYELIRSGFDVRVIEKYPEPGGMLRWAIPSFRLPQSVLTRDIEYLLGMGLKIETGVALGSNLALSDLKAEGADAVVIAVGTHRSVKMGRGETDRVGGYEDCLTFLRRYAEAGHMNVGRNVVVIGGGNAAVDTARVAKRMKAECVTILYRRGLEEMPADRSELRDAEGEGVVLRLLTQPLEVVTRDNQVQGIRCLRTELCDPDESGRRRPVPVQGSEFVLPANQVVVAIGQQADLSWNEDAAALKVSGHGTLAADHACATEREGVYAAGDCVSGPGTITEAMASGRRAAHSVIRFLTEKGGR